MGKIKIVKKVLLGVVALLLVISIGFYFNIQQFGKEVSRLEINILDFTTIEDGVYTGEYFHNEMVGAMLEVTVENHRITNISILEHKYGFGQKAEVILQQVMDTQSLKVDTISGATGSSKILLKAIENALTNKI